MFTVPHLMFSEVYQKREKEKMALQVYLRRQFFCILASSSHPCKKTSQNANRTLREVDGSKHGKQFGRSLDIRKSISCSYLYQPVLSKRVQMVCLAWCKTII